MISQFINLCGIISIIALLALIIVSIIWHRQQRSYLKSMKTQIPYEIGDQQFMVASLALQGWLQLHLKGPILTIKTKRFGGRTIIVVCRIDTTITSQKPLTPPTIRDLPTDI